MGIYKKDDNYFIDYYVSGRRKREKIGSSKKLAEIVLKKRKVEVAEGKFLDIDRQEKIKFEDFACQYLAVHSKNNKSYYTDCKNADVLKRFFGGKYLNEITVMDVNKFKTERAQQVSVATTNRALSLLKSMFNRAVEWDKTKNNPVRKIKLFKENNKRLRFLEQEEITKLLSNCSNHLYPIVIVAINTGMRKGEILSLKWHDIDFQRDVAHLLNTKSGEKREIPLNETAKRTLIAIPKHPDSPYIFCNKNGEPYGDIKKSFLTAIGKSGIINFHFHDLRHTFASHLVMSGIDLNTVRELLGHHSLDMTLRYSHLSPDHKKRAVDILGKRIDTFKTPDSKNVESDFLTVSQLVENKAVVAVGL